MRFGTFTLSAIAFAALMLGVGSMAPESRPTAPTREASADIRITQALAEGDKQRAVEQFGTCIQTGLFFFADYQMAKAFRKRLTPSGELPRALSQK